MLNNYAKSRYFFNPINSFIIINEQQYMYFRSLAQLYFNKL